METWIEEKGWRKIEEKLPKGYIWEKQWGKKRRKKKSNEKHVNGS